MCGDSLRFQFKLSYILAKYVTNQLGENHEQIRNRYYGFQVIIGEAVKLLILFFLSLLLGIFETTVIAAVLFALLRRVAGGYHMDTYGSCLIISLGLLIIAGSIGQYTTYLWSDLIIYFLISIVFIISLFSAIKWAPDDNINRPITEPEDIKKFKRSSLFFIIIWAMISIISILLKMGSYKAYVISGAFSVLFEIFSITPAGHRFFNIIKNGFVKVKKTRKLEQYKKEA